MIDLKQWMEVVNYQITEGSKYCWNCYGEYAYRLDSWNGDNDNGWSAEIIFDTLDQEVYEVQVHDYKRKRAYRMINPDYLDSVRREAEARDVKFDEATDEYNFIDLEADVDWAEKTIAIVNGEDYDTRISIPVNFTDEELLRYMTAAHEEDLTFNQFVEKALRTMIDKMKATGELPDEIDEITSTRGSHQC